MSAKKSPKSPFLLISHSEYERLKAVERHMLNTQTNNLKRKNESEDMEGKGELDITKVSSYNKPSAGHIELDTSAPYFTPVVEKEQLETKETEVLSPILKKQDSQLQSKEKKSKKKSASKTTTSSATTSTSTSGSVPWWFLGDDYHAGK